MMLISNTEKMQAADSAITLSGRLPCLVQAVFCFAGDLMAAFTLISARNIASCAPGTTPKNRSNEVA